MPAFLCRNGAQRTLTCGDVEALYFIHVFFASKPKTYTFTPYH